MSDDRNTCSLSGHPSIPSRQETRCSPMAFEKLLPGALSCCNAALRFEGFSTSSPSLTQASSALPLVQAVGGADHRNWEGTGFRARVERGHEPTDRRGAETGWKQRRQSKTPLANSDSKSPDSKVKSLPLQFTGFTDCCAMRYPGPQGCSRRP